MARTMGSTTTTIWTWIKKRKGKAVPENTRVEPPSPVFGSAWWSLGVHWKNRGGFILFDDLLWFMIARTQLAEATQNMHTRNREAFSRSTLRFIRPRPSIHPCLRRNKSGQVMEPGVFGVGVSYCSLIYKPKRKEKKKRGKEAIIILVGLANVLSSLFPPSKTTSQPASHPHSISRSCWWYVFGGAGRFASMSWAVWAAICCRRLVFSSSSSSSCPPRAPSASRSVQLPAPPRPVRPAVLGVGFNIPAAATAALLARSTTSCCCCWSSRASAKLPAPPRPVLTYCGGGACVPAAAGGGGCACDDDEESFWASGSYWLGFVCVRENSSLFKTVVQV